MEELVTVRLLRLELLRALPALFDDADGHGIKDECAVAIPLSALDPTDGGSVRSGAQFASGDAAQVVGDDVVIADAAVFAMNAVEQFDKLDGLDVEAGFLADFADDAGGEGFTDFEHATRESPAAFEGLGGAANQEHACFLNDESADADEGRRRKFAFDAAVDFGVHAISQFCHGRCQRASLNTDWARIAQAALSSNKDARERIGRIYAENRWNALRLVRAAREPGAGCYAGDRGEASWPGHSEVDLR